MSDEMQSAKRRDISPDFAAHNLRILLYGLILLFVVAAGLIQSRPALAQGAVHVVARGEHLSGIARRYGVSIEELLAYNSISNANLIYIGQRLMIPGRGSAGSGAYGVSVGASSGPAGGGYYVVKRGDTLSQIAVAYGISTADLMRLNNISNPRVIWVGQKLRVSARVPAAAGNEPAPASRPQVAASIYVVRRGDTLSEIAQRFGTTVQALMGANGLPNARHIWVGQKLRIDGATAGGQGSETASAPANGKRWIEINLTNQTLTAWQGNVAIMHTTISSGLPGTPTVTGRFRVGAKYTAQRMIGEDYNLPNVPWVMYFYGDYAIHGAYWHNLFGRPMSHGCVNMRVGEAEALYRWAPAGTEVHVHY
jgi:LysM repeat protein